MNDSDGFWKSEALVRIITDFYYYIIKVFYFIINELTKFQFYSAQFVN